MTTPVSAPAGHDPDELPVVRRARRDFLNFSYNLGMTYQASDTVTPVVGIVTR
jgi:hypothetical protein